MQNSFQNTFADTINDPDSTIDLTEGSVGHHISKDVYRNYFSDKECFFQSQLDSLKQITCITMSELRVKQPQSSSQSMTQKVDQSSNKDIASKKSNKKMFQQDKFYTKQDRKRFSKHSNLDNDKESSRKKGELLPLDQLELKMGRQIIRKQFGEEVEQQFSMIFKMFVKENANEIGCLERLWEEFEGNNVHIDVFRAAYILLNVISFERSTVYQELYQLCLDLQNNHSNKVRKFKKYLTDITSIYTIKLIY